MQAITDIIQILFLKGLRQVVVSPGSRSAPLTIAFARHQGIKKIIVPDERAAAFIALGIAQSTQNPVALICTSGTAALNYAPAVAEAFYAKVPLILLTADRPTEWIDQMDGQTIRQQNLYGAHAKGFFQLLPDRDCEDTQWLINRSVNEAYNLAKIYPQGAVQINIPLREPLYSHEWNGFSDNCRLIEEEEIKQELTEETWNKFLAVWHSSENKLIVAGRGHFESAVGRFLSKMNYPIVADAPANISSNQAIKKHDIFLKATTYEALKPDFLLTCGEEVLSKRLKNFIRKNPPKYHFHLSPAGAVADTFQSLTNILRVEPNYFFGQLFKRQACGISNHYLQKWQQFEEEATQKLEKTLQQKVWAEFDIIHFLYKNLPNDAHLHLGNSMSVRYANVFDWAKKNIQIWSNRGTSGIDGCTSTAIGHALSKPEKQHFLLIGDISFLYDKNAFWHNQIPNNLQIFVLNNHGGSIFKMIDGPKNWAECEEYFVIEQKQNASNLANEYHFSYYKAENYEELKLSFALLLAESKLGILEIFTQNEQNDQQYQQLMNT